MAVDHVEELRREPYEDGAAFEPAGRYERLDLRVTYAADPALPVNAAIPDFERARPDGDGKVRFEGDLVVLRPVGAGAANGHLLVSVVNRGNRQVVPFSGPAPLEITDRIHPGDGFLLRQGWTVAFCGWQWDVIDFPERVTFEAPLACDTSTDVTVRFQLNRAADRVRLAHWPLHPPAERFPRLAHAAYPVAVLDDPRARLVADGVAVDRRWWRFPDAEQVELTGGFAPGVVYEVTYRTDRCPVVGAGLVAIRDATAHLRRTFGINRTFGWGVSQTGRFLREFLWRGQNVDEAGRRVFDGLYITVAGARRGEFAVRGGQPSSQYGNLAGFDPPYRYDELLAPYAGNGGTPRIVHVDSANEYWRSEAGLVHTDAGADVDPPPEVRLYLLAGAQHFPGFAVLLDSLDAFFPGIQSANFINTLNTGPLQRALLVALQEWVAGDVEPPPTAVPRIDRGTAATREEVLAALAERIPAVLPGALCLPAAGSKAIVSAVDAEGQEVAGIRHPELAVPLGVFLGWNPRHPSIGAEGELLDMVGSIIPFSVVEIGRRYADAGSYVDQVRAACDDLVARRLLLAADVDGVLRSAGRLHELLTKSKDENLGV